MMQKCSELGNNPEAWQQLFRFGKNRLKIKKGPDGHYLEQECRDELQRTLPAAAFESLMSSVATWMTRLDEKDKKAQRQRKAAVKVPKKPALEPPVEQTSEVGDSNELSAVVDLCSEGDEKDSLDAFDTETVLSQSSVIIIDEDLGEVNLKEFADHLDVQALKKKNQNTTQDSVVKFLGPQMSDALRRPLKTYARKRKSTDQTIVEAIREIMHKDPKILREVNREASREAGQVSKKSDCQAPKVIKEVAPDGDATLVAAGNSQQKLQIVTEPTAFYNLVAKPDAEDKLKLSELESKSDVERQTEPEIRTNAKENTPKGFNIELANGQRTKEGALPEDSLRNQRLGQDDHAPQIRIRTDLGAHPRDVIRVRTDLLLENPPEESLSSLENQSSSAETLVPERTANKRILSEAQSSQQPHKRPVLVSYYPQYSVAAPPSSSQVSIVTPAIISGYPTSIASSQRNLAPVGPPPVNPTPVRPSQVNPVPAPPVVSVKYKLIHPKTLTPITSISTSTCTTASNSYQGNVSNSCQPNLSSTSSHNHNSVNSASASSSGYPSGSHMRPVTSISSHQPNNPANCAPITNGIHYSANLMPPPPAPSLNYSTVPSVSAAEVRSAPSPIIPMMNNFPPLNQYRPAMSMPAAPLRMPMYRPVAPAASIPPLSYAAVPPVAPAPAIAKAGGASVLNAPIDLTRIMGMLSQVEVFAFRQQNQEACNLVVQLRKSLEGRAAVAYR